VRAFAAELMPVPGKYATSLLHAGDKYLAPFVNEAAVRFLKPSIATNPAFVFGAAVVYHHPISLEQHSPSLEGQLFKPSPCKLDTTTAILA